MFDFIRNNIRNKLLLLLSSTLIALALAVYIGFSSLANLIDDYAQNVNEDVTNLTRISTLNVRFKTQVQEWKNTLIRGKDQEQREKYWGRFLASGKAIQQDAKDILATLSSEHPSRQSLAKFAQGYPAMFSAYQSGYQQFVASGYDISVADKSVKGIDREPTENLNQAVEAMNQLIQGLQSQIDDRSSSVFTYTAIMILVVFVVSIIIIAWFIDSRILTPLNRVTVLSQNIAKGDFTGQIQSTTRDQIGQLTNNIMQVQGDLSGVLTGILKDLQELGHLIERLLSAFTKVKGGLQGQIQQAGHLQNKIAVLVDKGDSIEHSIDRSSEFVASSSKMANEGQQRFRQNVTTSNNMLSATDNAANIVATLKQDTDSIGSVVSVINGIAEQTNLLALNAAIEAARAGESGRGFAVVADEVRSLANKTQESTKQISDSITKLQGAADKAVEAMAMGTEQANISVQQATESQSFVDELNKAFSQLHTLNRQVQEAVKSQQQQSVEVNEGIQQIAKSSDHTQQEAKVMEEASKVLQQIFSNLEQATKRFKLKNR